ncbi:unnamed protein product [Rhizoctonia solani]|uniref:Fungal-type protein kinase domain-containing protein n=1 Tax=Rhizoctonia solani TaxID=456999 RepID=A0A8H3A8W3_9AGAM|nr:unnamed protein product [Rhizoctonia solani]
MRSSHYMNFVDRLSSTNVHKTREINGQSLMLNRIDKGCSSASKFKRNETDRSTYHLGPSELVPVCTSPKPTSSIHYSRPCRFKEAGVQYRRGVICGRAIPVSHVRGKLELDAQGREEYVLEISRSSLENSLGRVREVASAGIRRSGRNHDVPMHGKCEHPSIEHERYLACLEKMAPVNGLRICGELGGVDVITKGKGQNFERTTTKPPHVQPLRMHSRILNENVGIPLWQAESAHHFLTVMLDPISSYRAVFGQGIMHREISFGNVLMLNTNQGTTLAESEVRQYATIETGNHNPFGILRDFDSCTAHSLPSNCTPTTANNPGATELDSVRLPRRHQDEDPILEPSMKRRKTCTHIVVQVPSVCDQSQHQSKVNKHQLNSELRGIPYHHQLSDDLESFFWLILRSVAGHLDKVNQCLTPEAQAMLNGLGRSNPYTSLFLKMGILTFYKDHKTVMDELSGWGNEWASDPMISKVLTLMSSFLLRFTSTSGRKQIEAECFPREFFAEFVEIFRDPLDSDKQYAP